MLIHVVGNQSLHDVLIYSDHQCVCFPSHRLYGSNRCLEVVKRVHFNKVEEWFCESKNYGEKGLKTKTGSGQPDNRFSSSSSSSSSGGGSRRRHLASHSSVAVLLPCSPAPVACMQLITHRVCSVLCQCPTGHLCQCPTGHRPAADAAI